LGRGGAYFPVARKWETAINAPGDVYLVANLEEGEPGVFKDRHLCEGDPHAVVEGMLIAAFALQAPRVYIYINGQADRSAERIATAIAMARATGLVPDGLFIDILRGAWETPLDPRIEPVQIPFEGTTLPGYFYRGNGAGARPTVVIHGGFDGTAEENHFFGAAAFAERGYHVLSFDGPGQPG